MDKQMKHLQEKDMIIEDLKESVNLKITVTEDLQALLKQSQVQYEEVRKESKIYLKEKEQLIG